MSNIYTFETPNFQISHSLDMHPNEKDFPMHIHGHNEIFIFISGNASYLVEGNEYPLSKGRLLVIRESESHAIKFLSDEPYERFVIHFSSTMPLISYADPEHRLLSPFYDRALGEGNMYEASDFKNISILSCIKSMCADSEEEYEKRMAAMTHFLPLLEDISEAFRDKTSQKSVKDALSSQIIAYINEHLFENLTVPQIAAHFYMSVSQLERVFKKATLSSVWHYITAKRLSAARAAIENGAAANIAGEKCGFGDYSSFYRAYVKEFGEAPNTHRQKRT